MTWMKVVVERDGREREVVGWRKWAVAIPVLAIVALLVAVVALLLFGLALTIGAVLLIAVPLVLVLLLIGLAFGRYAMRTSAK